MQRGDQKAHSRKSARLAGSLQLHYENCVRMCWNVRVCRVFLISATRYVRRYIVLSRTGSLASCRRARPVSGRTGMREGEGTVEIASHGDETNLQPCLGRANLAHPSRGVRSLAGAEDLLDAAAGAPNMRIACRQPRQGFGTTPSACVCDARRAAVGMDRRLWPAARERAVSLHVTRSVRRYRFQLHCVVHVHRGHSDTVHQPGFLVTRDMGVVAMNGFATTMPVQPASLSC